MAAVQLRDEPLLMLEGRGAVLDVARAVTRVLVESQIDGAVIGGVAVALHGHVRATSDVDVYIPDPLAAFALSCVPMDFRSTQIAGSSGSAASPSAWCRRRRPSPLPRTRD